MKCIIADDEYLVRYSLQDMLEDLAREGKFTFESITQASLGSELLRLLPQIKPDVVFVDIRMPYLNGLEAMEQGRILSPSTQWIILTGYSEFDYARKALSLDAVAYLLKPASPLELERALNLVSEKLVSTKEVQQIRLEHKLYGVLQDTYVEGLDDQDSDVQQGYYAGFILSIDSPEKTERTIQLRNDFIQKIKQWSLQASDCCSTAGLVLLDDGNYAGVISSPSLERTPRFLHHIVGQIEKLSAHQALLSCTVFLLKEERRSLTQLITDLVAVSKQSYIRLFQGYNAIVDELMLQRNLKTVLPFEQFLISFERCIKNREFESISAIQLIKKHKELFFTLWQQASFRAFMHFMSSQTFSETDAEKAFTDSLRWLESFITDPEEVLGPRMQRTVTKALEFIQEHVNEEIGLAQVADAIGVTPNYLSTIFNKVVGETFPQYVTKLRMEKAVKLLREESLTVKEVASRVGYVSCRHFSKVFKQYNGQTPSEYVLLKSNLRNWYQIQRN